MERSSPYPNGWLLILRGVLAILFGGLALAHPLAALAALVLLFGVWALLDGISALALYFGGWRSWQLALVGLVGIAAAAVTFWRPTITAVGLYAAIAGWAILRGVLEIGIAIKLRKEIQGELWLVLAGLSSLVFGVLLIALPMAGMLALAWLIGVYALLFGGLLIALGVRVQRLERRETPFRTPHPI